MTRSELPWSSLTLREWIDEQISHQFGTLTELARRLGVHLTVLQRGADVGTFSETKLLKLAKIAGENPSVVLCLANKGDVADLIESLYARPPRSRLRTRSARCSTYLPKHRTPIGPAP